MAHPRITVGLHVPPKPPLLSLRGLVLAARLMRLDLLTVWDHFQDLFPEPLWDRDLTWMADGDSSPHQLFDYQVLLGYLAGRAGGLRLGVAVTESVRRHPVLIAQSMLTLAHMTKRPPVLGMGSGERENIEPYGLDFSQPVGRLEEALQIIRMCFTSQGPISFHGKHFQLDNAVMDLQAPKGRTPKIWVAAHGPRMLRLTGTYGDGWYPTVITSPEDYASKLAVIQTAATSAGRDPQAIIPSLEARIVSAPTEQEARALLSTKAIRFVGVLAPADTWRRFGLEHPFGDEFRGFIDFVPQRYSRKMLDEAINAVPVDALAEGMLWGTPEQIVGKLRTLGAAGLRHANLELTSAIVSRRAALYSLRALNTIARELRRTT